MNNRASWNRPASGHRSQYNSWLNPIVPIYSPVLSLELNYDRWHRWYLSGRSLTSCGFPAHSYRSRFPLSGPRGAGLRSTLPPHASPADLINFFLGMNPHTHMRPTGVRISTFLAHKSLAPATLLFPLSWPLHSPLC